MMVKLLGFSPGLDPTTAGVILDCTNLLPTVRGSMESAGVGESVGASAIPAPVYDVSSNVKLDGSSRVFAYTGLAIYELIGAAWIDRSKAGGYTTGAGNKWRHCQFGDVSIATNYANPVQASTIGAFADLAGSPPKAAICETVAGFVMLFDTNDGANQHPDGWWCSGLYNHTTWTPSVTTQAANGRLFDTPGRITAARRLGSSIVVYKNKSLYLGQYIGAPVIWQWVQVSDDTGAYCNEAVVSTGGAHYFLGDNGIFVYDGSRQEQIGTAEVRGWLRDNINQEYTSNIKAAYDSKKSLVYFFYPSNSSSGECDESLVYNTFTGRFGRITRDITAIFNYTTPNITWSQLGALYATWGGFPNNITWGSPLFYGSDIGISYVGGDGIIYRLESDGAPSSLTVGDVGDDTAVTLLGGVRARYLKSPVSAQMENYYKRGEGDALTSDKVVSMKDFKFDVLRSSRFHRFTINFTGSHEVSAIDVNLTQNGLR